MSEQEKEQDVLEIKPLLTPENITKYLLERYQQEKFTIPFELLAELAHDLWVQAMIFYVTNEPEVQVAKTKIAYWENNCFMPYDKLSENQKNKDRKLVLDWLFKNKLLE